MENGSVMVKIGQVYRIKDLKGALSKQLEVPTGYRGVAQFADGATQVFPPGTHTVLPWGRRVSGKGAGFRCAVLADGPFQMVTDVPHLLSGDGELVDLCLGIGLEMDDPVQALRSAQVAEDGSLIPDMDRVQLQRLVQPLVRQYTASDLALDLPGERLLAELGARVQPLFTGSGLRMQPVHWVAVTPAADRAQIAAKLQEIDEKLQDVDLEKHLSQAESEAQLKEFLGDLQPDAAQFSVRVAPASSAADEKPFTRWKAGLHSATQKRPERPDNLLKRLFSRGKPEEVNKVREQRPRIPRRWWLSNIITMLIFLIIGLTLTYLVKVLTEGAQPSSRFDIYIDIWAAIIAIELDAAKRLYEKREQLAEALWAHPDKTHLDILARNNRQRADALVRNQSVGVLHSILEKLDDTQSRVFSGGSGDTTLALKVRDLRRKMDEKVRKIQDTTYGVPAYMTDLNVTWQAWLSMLDYDEDLLLRANALDEEAFMLQDKVSGKQLKAEALDQFEKDVDFFMHCFAARNRAVKE